MRFLTTITILLVLFIVPSVAFAQETEADTVDMGFLLQKERAGNFMLHTLGYGVGYRFGYNKTYYQNRMLEFDLLEMKAPNQHRRYNEFLPNPRSYIYSKLNNLYILRAGVGQQHLLNRKPYWGGVEVRMFYYGGISAGIAKPVYLYIAYYTYDATQDLTFYSLALEKYDPTKHFPYRGQNTKCDCDIGGRGPILSGFDGLKIYPGLYGKFGFNFEFSDENDKIKSLETGISLDAFPKGVPLMAYSNPYQLFFTGYISFHLGKRYN